jgi:hypothetical protein
MSGPRYPESEPGVDPASPWAAEIAELRRKVQQNDDEIDALQIDAARQETRATRPWYQDGSLLIAVMALLFSFGTTAVSYARLDQESAHEARQELTGYMQRLGEQPRLAAEIQLQYGAAQSNELLSFVNAETELLATQARTVMLLIPDQVTTLEYVTVGYAFQTSAHLPDAQEMYGRGRDVARNPLDRVVSLRALGNVRYLVGDTAGGRAFFAQARAVYARESDAPRIVVSSVDAETELRWASAEILVGECAEAARHVALAEQQNNDLIVDTFGPLIEQMKQQVAACRPRPVTSPIPIVLTPAPL